MVYCGSIPELPEVETVVRRLSTHLVGSTFLKVFVHNPQQSQFGVEIAFDIYDCDNILKDPKTGEVMPNKVIEIVYTDS